jgi:hypothetical protein
MSLNFSKTKFIIFHVQGKRIEQSTTLQIDAKLPPPTHYCGMSLHLSSTLKLIRLSDLSTCLHPSSPTAADEGRLRQKKPKSLQLLIPLPAHPSLLPTPCTYPLTTQNSSHFICHLVSISRWPITLACHLSIFHLCYA